MIKISNLLNFYIYLFIHKKADVFFAKRFNFVEITLDKNQLIAIRERDKRTRVLTLEALAGVSTCSRNVFLPQGFSFGFGREGY